MSSASMSTNTEPGQCAGWQRRWSEGWRAAGQLNNGQGLGIIYVLTEEGRREM